MGDNSAAVHFFERAIRLDPNFAMAYEALARNYFNIGEAGLAAENAKKAYDLRERVSELEKLHIEGHYYYYVTGDLEKARQTYEVWAQTYPRDSKPRISLAAIYRNFGTCTNPSRKRARICSP